ncbi:MAG TPA: radical SAM protein [Planctomycetaceae bacterium]|nr:radical SAM protein [Planctomycetaceae bacterium]
MPALDRPTRIQFAAHSPKATHPLGSRARVLLASVFGPYGEDDQYGSRRMNPMELYHNQVTREQGPFSVRMFHRSWGLMLIQCNLDAPCTVLDFPSLERFVQELRSRPYDVVGISSIIPNLLKVRKMCQLVRQYQPEATIVVGGHIANVPDLDQRVDADWVVKGEGVRWFRRFLGQDEDAPIRHPLILSAFGTRNLGISARERPGDVAATIIPSVGCPMGCNFCSTSAMFGGKGKFIDFYETGDELFQIMCQVEEAMQVCSFFVMDENFLLHRKRALRLLELMEAHDKAWALHVFSSANVLRRYSMEQLVGLGISWVWMGLEGKDSRYAKLRGTDTFQLVRQLQSHGIRVLGSTIIGLEDHTPENIDAVIDYAVRYDTDFHQFMLYTPIPGTPLFAELSAQGRMKGEDEYHVADIHGQYIFNYRHPHIPEGAETELLRRAFRRDFEVNGPSVARIVRTTLAGWKRYRNHPHARIRRRFAWEARELDTTYSAVLAAMKGYYRHQPRMYAKMREILGELHRHFGWKSRVAAVLGGPYVLWKTRREAKRLASGWTYEPPTFYEANEAAWRTAVPKAEGLEPCQSVVVPTVERGSRPAPDPLAVVAGG